MQQEQRQQQSPLIVNGSDMAKYHGIVQKGQSNSNDNTNGTSSSSESADEDQLRIKFSDWGFKVDRLFEVAYRFYKRNESKAFHPSFDERNKMIALIMQARYGNNDGGRAPNLGALDLVGKRRQYEWSLLNGMSKTEAMSKFICALDDLCPIFKAHAEAVKISSGVEPTQDVRGSGLENDSNRGNSLNKSEAQETQMTNIYSSLCKQTYNQFKSYAEKQFPTDAAKQKYLITSLQEQYYQQYISQMYPELRDNLPSVSKASNSSGNIPCSLSSPASSVKSGLDVSTSEQTRKSTITIDNHLIPLPITRYLELPVPNEVQVQDQPEKSSNSAPKPGKVANSFDTSDVYFEENNVQADISCEEINSELIDAGQTSIPIGEDDAAPENKLGNDLKSLSITNELSKKADNNIIEPVRLFQNVDIPPIGVFESFPEPKPIKNTGHKATLIDKIDPNLPPKSRDPLFSTRIDDDEKQPKPKNVLKSNLQGDILSGTSTDLDFVAAQSITSKQRLDSRSENVELYNQTNRPGEDHFDTARQQKECYDSDNHTQFHGWLNESSSKSIVDQLKPQDPCLNSSERQCPELWDCASSSGNESPSYHKNISYEGIESATIWSKREVAEFKESLDDDKQAGIYEVKESTLVIIQVPTYPDGKYIYWEFATDDFDIGFGLEFVFENHLIQPLAINIYEDLEEDEMDEMIDEDNWRDQPSQTEGNHESGQLVPAPGQMDAHQKLVAERKRRLANTISIVPTYRRDSHQEVFVGRHKYPGKGYYLLRFDNTYSLLRSKTLYFRICYFM